MMSPMNDPAMGGYRIDADGEAPLVLGESIGQDGARIS
jgi:hypothetical protein